MRLLRLALANPQIVRIEAAWASVSLGTWSFTILLALYAYGHGGTSAVGIAVLANQLPSTFVAGYMAMLVDRSSRRRALQLCAGARGVIMVGIGLAIGGGAPFAAVLVLAAAFTAVQTAYSPAQAALLPQVARSPDELAAANVAWGTIEQAGCLAGSLLAGALAVLTGLSGAFMIGAIPMLAATVVLATLAPDAAPDALPGAEETGALEEILEGFRVVAAEPDLRLLVGIFGAQALLQGIADVLLVVLSFELLGLGDAGVGWLNAAWGAGGLLGGGLTLLFAGRGRLATAVGRGCVLAGLPLVVLAVWHVPAGAIVLFALLGAGFGLVVAALPTLTQRLAADDVLGRVYGVQETVLVVTTALGSMGAAGLVAVLGAEGALLASGVVLPLLALLLRRRLGGMEAGAPVPQDVYALLRGLPMFSPLPVATVETLALRADRVAFGPGEAIVRQGDPGDAFFVIEDGTVSVTEDGAFRRESGAGECFGEIALLRAVPRTATVDALTPVRALSITPEDFLASIGAHPRSGHAAERIVSERLGVPT